MQLFEFNEYKLALKAQMDLLRQQFGVRFTYEKMASECKVQKTYLSRVLNGAGHLNADQLFSACTYLKLNPDETDFILLLREWELSLISSRKKQLKNKILEVRKQQLKSEKFIESNEGRKSAEDLWEYYTDVDLQLVYIFLTVSSYANNPNAICNKINISDAQLKSILSKLQDWKFIHFKDGKLFIDQPKLHLSENSPIRKPHHILQRLKTIERMKQLEHGTDSNIVFSSIFSADVEFQTQFKKKLLNLIKEAQTQVLTSEAQEVYQLNIDLLKWS